MLWLCRQCRADILARQSGRWGTLSVDDDRRRSATTDILSCHRQSGRRGTPSVDDDRRRSATTDILSCRRQSGRWGTPSVDDDRRRSDATDILSCHRQSGRWGTSSVDDDRWRSATTDILSCRRQSGRWGTSSVDDERRRYATTDILSCHRQSGRRGTPSVDDDMSSSESRVMHIITLGWVGLLILITWLSGWQFSDYWNHDPSRIAKWHMMTDSTIHNHDSSRELMAIVVDDTRDSGYEIVERVDVVEREDWLPPPREDDVAMLDIAIGTNGPRNMNKNDFAQNLLWVNGGGGGGGGWGCLDYTVTTWGYVDRRWSKLGESDYASNYPVVTDWGTRTESYLAGVTLHTSNSIGRNHLPKYKTVHWCVCA